MDKDAQIREEQVNQIPENKSTIDYEDQYWKAQMEIDTLKRTCKAQAELIAKLLR